MQRYYRTVMDVSLLNELLLQLFREAILTETEPPRPLNARFQVRNGSLEAVSDDVFARTPVGAARDVRAAAAEPGDQRRARLDHARGRHATCG